MITDRYITMCSQLQEKAIEIMENLFHFEIGDMVYNPKDGFLYIITHRDECEGYTELLLLDPNNAQPLRSFNDNIYDQTWLPSLEKLEELIKQNDKNYNEFFKSPFKPGEESLAEAMLRFHLETVYYDYFADKTWYDFFNGQ